MNAYSPRINRTSPVITGNGIASSNHYEVVKDSFRIKPKKDFSVTIADAAASPPTGWTLDNSGRLDAADANTTTANALFMSHGSTASAFGSTIPFYNKTFDRTLESRVWYCRLTGENLEATGTDMVCIFINANSSTWVIAGLQNNGGSYRINAKKNGGSDNTFALTAGQVSAGVWIKMEVQDDNIIFYASTTDQATPPTDSGDWNFVGRIEDFLNDNTTGNYEVGFGMRGISSSTANGECLYWSDPEGYLEPFIQADSGASGYDSNNTEVQLLTDWDVLSSAPTVNQTLLREAFQSAENLLDNDSATWTYSIVRSDSASAVSSTYQAANALTVSGTGRYISVYAKCNSSGTQPGSLRLPIILPLDII